MIVHERPSPNHGPRPEEVEPDLIIIHGTAGQSAAGDLAWLTDPNSGVSCHYLIDRDGAVYRLVPDERRAWHAGVSAWEGRPDCNDYSIGIELCNDGQEPYTDAQYVALAGLCYELIRRWHIPVRRIVGHSHVSPGRKTDPWGHFEWMRLAEALMGCYGVRR